MEIHLPGITRAVMHLGAAIDEVRGAIRPADPSMVRVQTEDRAVELPIGFFVVGLFAALLLLSTRSGNRAIEFPAREHLGDRTLGGRAAGTP